MTRFRRRIRKGVKYEYYDFLYDWLVDLIYEYCDRHGYEIMEIDWRSKSVFYYKEGQNMFEDYTSFNYLKVDLFN